jgi:hypothetical protein
MASVCGGSGLSGLSGFVAQHHAPGHPIAGIISRMFIRTASMAACSLPNPLFTLAGSWDKQAALTA